MSKRLVIATIVVAHSLPTRLVRVAAKFLTHETDVPAELASVEPMIKSGTVRAHGGFVHRAIPLDCTDRQLLHRAILTTRIVSMKCGA